MIPAYAERLSYLDHEKIVPTYSRFMPGQTVHRSMFDCPSCAARREPLPVCETVVCVACDLHMRADTAYLHVWRPLNLGRIAGEAPAMIAAE